MNIFFFDHHSTMTLFFPLDKNSTHICSDGRGYPQHCQHINTQPVKSRVMKWKCRLTVWSPRWDPCVVQIQLGRSNGKTAEKMSCRKATSNCLHSHSSRHRWAAPQRPAQKRHGSRKTWWASQHVSLKLSPAGASRGSLQLLLFAFVTTARKLIDKGIIRPNESALC